MRIAIMQPYIFPYIGYFQLIKSVDTFIFYDDVNFIKHGWINRNKILINGEESLITFPCLKISQNKEIKEIEVDLSDKQYAKILKSVYYAYINAPYFKNIYPLVQECLQSNSKTISDLAIYSIQQVCDFLNIETKFERSSLKYPNTKHLSKANRLIEITKRENATKYINAIGGQELYTKEYFKDKKIDLHFLKSKKYEYIQFNNDFVPNLSIIDVLMFNSKENVREMICNYELV